MTREQPATATTHTPRTRTSHDAIPATGATPAGDPPHDPHDPHDLNDPHDLHDLNDPPIAWVPDPDVPAQSEHHDLTSLEQFGHLTHAVRGRLLMSLVEGGTVAELAEQLGMKPTSLYHHINALDEAGLIVVSHTRRVGVVTQRRYRTIARTMSLPAEIAESASSEQLAMLNSTTFDLAKATMLHAYRRGLVGPHEWATAGFDLFRLNLTLEERAAFMTDLRDLLLRYRLRGTEGAEPFEFFFSAQPAPPRGRATPPAD